jgi:hypothetical protein
LKTLQTILESVVAISTTGYPIPVSQSIVPMPKSVDEFMVGEGLGLISGGLIYTCTHFQQHRWPLLPGEVAIYAAWCVNDDTMPHGFFAGYYASSLDLMMLAPDGMTVHMSEEDGPTETGLDLICAFQEKHGPGIRPAEIQFPADAESAKIRGFFLAADGKTLHRTFFKIWKYSARIEFYSNDFTKGCSGGPIFTDNYQFIGVATVGTTHPDLNGLHHCLGVRIDQCMPRLLTKDIQWAHLVIQPETDRAPDPNDPWEQQTAAIARLETTTNHEMESP